MTTIPYGVAGQEIKSLLHKGKTACRFAPAAHAIDDVSIGRETTSCLRARSGKTIVCL
jgi:hypothetical protein